MKYRSLASPTPLASFHKGLREVFLITVTQWSNQAKINKIMNPDNLIFYNKTEVTNGNIFN